MPCANISLCSLNASEARAEISDFCQTHPYFDKDLWFLSVETVIFMLPAASVSSMVMQVVS